MNPTDIIGPGMPHRDIPGANPLPTVSGHRCEYCRHDFASSPKGCERSYLVIKGERFKRLAWGGVGAEEDCPHCRTPPGRYHHSGCDYEVCPKCHKYLVTPCTCNAEPAEARPQGSRYQILRLSGDTDHGLVYDRHGQTVGCYCFSMDLAARVCTALNEMEKNQERGGACHK